MEKDNGGLAVLGLIIGALAGGLPGALLGGLAGSVIQEFIRCPRCGEIMKLVNGIKKCPRCGYSNM